jgi:hypothetical protein
VAYEECSARRLESEGERPRYPNACASTFDSGVRCQRCRFPIWIRVRVIAARATAFRRRTPVGRSVVRLGCPSYKPASGSPVRAKPRRMWVSSTVSRRKASVNKHVSPML